MNIAVTLLALLIEATLGYPEAVLRAIDPGEFREVFPVDTHCIKLFTKLGLLRSPIRPEYGRTFRR